MSELNVILLAGLLGLGIAGIVTSMVASQQLYARLRDRFPDRWHSLGDPTGRLFKPYDRAHRRDISRFLWGREYASLGDPELTRLGTTAIAGVVVFAGSIVGAILLPLTEAKRTEFFPSVSLVVVGTIGVFLWLAAVFWVFHRLQSHHHAKYTAMGEPGLFLNNNWRTFGSLIKFIYKREHSTLGDRPLSIVADLMAVYLPVMLWFTFKFHPHYYSRR